MLLCYTLFTLFCGVLLYVVLFCIDMYSFVSLCDVINYAVFVLCCCVLFPVGMHRDVLFCAIYLILWYLVFICGVLLSNILCHFVMLCYTFFNRYMLYCAMLCHLLLYYCVLLYVVLRYIVQCCTVLYCIVLYCIVLYCIVM